MQPVKYSARDTVKIDLETKVIFKYPTPTKDFDVGYMILKGRHPKSPNAFIFENECSFVIYVLSGTGKIYAGDNTFEVVPKDVVFVPAKNNFAAEGDFEYVTFDSPAFLPEQSSEVKVD
jgi:mannose-6-phosphate isomerase-like protein (cupin superfamily)